MSANEAVVDLLVTHVMEGCQKIADYDDAVEGLSVMQLVAIKLLRNVLVNSIGMSSDNADEKQLWAFHDEFIESCVELLKLNRDQNILEVKRAVEEDQLDVG